MKIKKSKTVDLFFFSKICVFIMIKIWTKGLSFKMKQESISLVEF